MLCLRNSFGSPLMKLTCDACSRELSDKQALYYRSFLTEGKPYRVCNFHTSFRDEISREEYEALQVIDSLLQLREKGCPFPVR